MPRPPLPVGSWGTIATKQLDDGSWRASCRVRDVDGKVRPVARFAKTKTRADAALKAELLNRTQPTLSTIRPASTVADLVRVWLAEVDASDRSPGTKLNYHTACRHIVGRDAPLASIPVSQVTVAGVKAAIRNRPPVVKTVYNALFDLAVEHGARESNPARAVRGTTLASKGLPDVDARDTSRALTKAQRDVLLAALDADDPHDLADVTAFMLATGCRLGEALAMRWTHIDDTTGVARIEATMGRGYIQEWTKTDKDGATTLLKGRAVYLPAWMLERLRRREAANDTGNLLGLIFPSTVGTVRWVGTVGKLYRETLDGLDLPWATSHSLRRTVATLLDDSGVSRSRNANQLGHSSTRTLDRYLDRRAADPRVADIL